MLMNSNISVQIVFRFQQLQSLAIFTPKARYQRVSIMAVLAFAFSGYTYGVLPAPVATRTTSCNQTDVVSLVTFMCVWAKHVKGLSQIIHFVIAFLLHELKYTYMKVVIIFAIILSVKHCYHQKKFLNNNHITILVKYFSKYQIKSS